MTVQELGCWHVNTKFPAKRFAKSIFGHVGIVFYDIYSMWEHRCLVDQLKYHISAAFFPYKSLGLRKYDHLLVFEIVTLLSEILQNTQYDILLKATSLITKGF